MTSRIENSDLIHIALAQLKLDGYLLYGAHLEASNLYWLYLVLINRKKDDPKFVVYYKDELVFIEEKSCKALWSEQEQLYILKARIDSIIACL